MIINNKPNDVINLNYKENRTSKIPLGGKNKDKEKKAEIIFDKK